MSLACRGRSDERERPSLAGLKVVAIEQAVAAPFCTSRLADAGAEVIKIERPEGDFARGYDQAAAGQSSYFVWLNRGKTSLTLDLSTDHGKAELEGLLADADVLIQNLKRARLPDWASTRNDSPATIPGSSSAPSPDMERAARWRTARPTIF